MKIKSNGPRPSAASCDNVVNAGPRRSSTTPDKPARAMLACATSACFGSASNVINRPSAGNARAQPDGAVPAECADPKNGTRPESLCQQLQQLALVRRDVDLRQTRRVAGGQGCFQRGIARHKQVRDITVNRRPFILIHFQLKYKTPEAIEKPKSRNNFLLRLGFG